MLRRTHDVDYCTAFCRLEDRSECAYWTGHTPQKCGDAKIYDRLHEYEATGLTPEEVIAQRSTLAEYHTDADPLLRAKVEDRLVVLPTRQDKRRDMLALMAALHVIEKRYPSEVLFCPRDNDGVGLPEFIGYDEAEKRLHRMVKEIGG